MKQQSKTQRGNAKAKALVKNLRKMGLKEFLKRWKQCIEGITPYQQARGQLIGLVPILIGLIIGIVVVSISKTWWLLLILIGSLIVSIFQCLGFLQKFIRLKIQDKIMRQAMEMSSNSKEEVKE
jgi:hypothetical protein